MKKIAAILLIFSMLVPTAFASYVAAPGEVNRGYTGAASFTSNLPLIGNGTSPLTQGTVSGNTTEFGTVTGSLVSGDCLKADASGNIEDSGAACSASAGTVTSVSVVSTNGFAGTVANATTTPAITVETTVTGVLYGNGTSVAAATAAEIPAITVVNGGNASYSILSGDGHIRSGTALTGDHTYTLDACTSNIGERHVVKNLASQTFAITVAGNGSDTVDGAASYVLQPGDSVSVICAVSGAWDIE